MIQPFVLLLAGGVLLAGAATAQMTTLAVGPELAVPTGNFASMNDVGGGLSARIAFPFAPRFLASFTGSFLSFGSKDYAVLIPDRAGGVRREVGTRTGIVSVKLGVVYMLDDHFYVEPQLGTAYMDRGHGFLFGDVGGDDGYGDCGCEDQYGNKVPDGAGVAFAGNVGYRVKWLDVRVRYEGIARYGGFGFWGVGVRYVFGMGWW